MAAIPREDGIYSGISDADYHADRSSLSSSGARLMLPPSCPAIFAHQQAEPPSPKPEYDFGHAAHKFVLGAGAEIVNVPFDGWRSKEAKEARIDAWAADKVPLLTAQIARADTMARAVREHPVAHLVFESGEPELSGYWTDPETGVRLRYRPDWLCDRGRVVCVDYKTAASANPAHFARAAADFGYHIQEAWYRAGLAANDIGEDVDFLFVVQAKTPPYPVSVIRLDPAAVELGARVARRAIDLYAQCAESDFWPGYGDAIHTVTLPNYAIAQQERELSA